MSLKFGLFEFGHFEVPTRIVLNVSVLFRDPQNLGNVDDAHDIFWMRAGFAKLPMKYFDSKK